MKVLQKQLYTRCSCCAGKAKQPHRVINIKAEENDDNADLDGTEGSDFDDEYDDEKSFDSDDAEDEVLGDDDYDNDDDGVGEKGLMSSIIVKADSGESILYYYFSALYIDAIFSFTYCDHRCNSWYPGG